ncbi:hypothetical protein Tco_0711684 [Tanacetum coccineum]
MNPHPSKTIPQNTIIDTTLALIIPSLITSQGILNQGIEISPLALRAFVFSTPPSSPLEPHPYLTSLDDLSPRSSNPPPLTSSQGQSQTLPQQTPMDFEPSFPPINLSRSRLRAQPEPFMSKEQVRGELSQLHSLSHNIEESIQNAQNVQNSLIPLPPSLPYKCHHQSTSPPPLQLQYHLLDHPFHHQALLFLLIIPYG